MRTSQLLIATLREAPADAEIASHRLLLRAGMIRKLAAGIYSWLPLGLKVLRKVETIVREEMDRAGAQEILMPGVQPAELWEESGRWEKFGPELLRLKDRHERDFCLGPTHEEIITDLVRREIRSYKQLPANFYQIQTKFRDEIRPRFGIMRAREFMMKDAYSFHLTEASLKETYDQMYATYRRIFDRLGLRYRAVLADSGNIGGKVSHEFHVLADSGEDQIVFTDNGEYAANIEMAAAPAPAQSRKAPEQELEKVATPAQHTIEDVSRFLKVSPEQCVKTLIVQGRDGEPVALVLRGDHDLNRVKVEKLDEVAVPLTFAGAEQIRKRLGCDIGSLGPVNLDIPVIVDHSAVQLSDFVCGANENDHHLTGVNWGRDVPEPVTADLRLVVPGETAPDGSGPLHLARGIEVGHIFQLGTRYSETMGANCLDESGKPVTLIMGCYGIGVSRIVAAAIEQNHDEKGIVWPDAIAPYQLVLVPVNMHKSEQCRDAVLSLYRECRETGIDVLLDDRQERPGVMFTDMELIGIPHRIVLSDKGLQKGTVEYKHRNDEKSTDIPLSDVIEFIRQRISKTSNS